MKKKLPLFLLMVVVVLGVLFSSCLRSKTTTQVDNLEPDASAPPPNLEGWKRIAKENWEVSLPAGEWAESADIDSELGFAMLNVEKGCVVIFGRDQTDASYSDFVVGTLKVFVDRGAKVHYVHHVTLNNQKFVTCEFDRNGEIVWMWLTTKNGVAYGLTCGGDDMDAGANIRQFCQSIAETVRIN